MTEKQNVMMFQENLNKRVGVIYSKTPKEVIFLGFGIYEGDFIPIGAMGKMAEIMRENSIKNPRILLDNKKFVYGCEALFDSEDFIKRQLVWYKNAGITIKETDIDEIRKNPDKYN
jgi:hypothetical protein